MPELIEYLEDGCSLEAVPHTYGCVKARDTQTIPNTYGFNIPNDFGTTDATDTYFHAISDTTTTYFYPPAVTNPSTPIICTDVVAIQAFLGGLSSGITYTINGYNEIVLTYANPGDENIWTFWLGNNIPDDYTNKLTPTLHDLQVDTFSFVPVQVIKFKNQDGTYIDKYFLPSTTSNLTEVVIGISDIFNFGECHECKKEIFATHQRYYVTSGIGIPSNYVAYWLGEIMETWLGQVGADTSNCFIHATHGILNGVADGGVGTDLISPFTGTTPGIPLTNVSLVQSMTNISAANMGLSSTDLIYAITNDNQPVWFLSPAAIALLPNNTYLHPYMYFTDTPGNYNTCDINVIAPYTIGDVKQTSAPSTQTTCTPIQEIKEKDSCTEKLSYRYILENGNGLLVEASTLISNFDETNVKLSCPEVNFLEKEVCGTIDGSTDNYELIRIYTRNPLTGVLSVIHYEDNFGNIVSGVIVETCCTCNTLCEVTPSLLPVNMRCDSYSRSNNVNNNLQNQGGWLSGYNNTLYFDKWSNTATYDLLMNDLGQTGLVGAPRNLQYQISGEINGNTFSGIVTIPVPTSGTPLSLANQINTIVGANVLDYDGYGWSFQYNTAWTSYSLLIGELADNHAGGFQDISFGWKWAVRLNAGVLEDGIGVDPNNLNNGNWFSATNCVSI